ncbi:gas vesicle protein GvpO [Streptomyces sp. NBC_00448]|uniref:gas vesicle protein GvpO n=1 Tax=Streptomyces sp. NBC_00448 TaxID=2903652 RepID=UPI002E1FB519
MKEERARQARSASSRTSARPKPVSGAEDAARQAAGTLGELIGRPTEGCSEVAPTEDEGWRVSVDVVEVPRIPDTTSLLATYEVELGKDGSLVSYRRVRRYWRGAADT